MSNGAVTMAIALAVANKANHGLAISYSNFTPKPGTHVFTQKCENETIDYS